MEFHCINIESWNAVEGKEIIGGDGPLHYK